ncbi:hypothetical protein E05_10630 [Plautia stali symbiont]|nr:hypothetical protein E05_10630 [Plautia stali symbiont]
MTSTHSLSLQTARNLHLSAQVPATPAAPPGAFCRYSRLCAADMSLLQIDTINVAARSPYLVAVQPPRRFSC